MNGEGQCGKLGDLQALGVRFRQELRKFLVPKLCLGTYRPKLRFAPPDRGWLEQTPRCENKRSRVRGRRSQAEVGNERENQPVTADEKPRESHRTFGGTAAKPAEIDTMLWSRFYSLLRGASVRRRYLVCTRAAYNHPVTAARRLYDSQTPETTTMSTRRSAPLKLLFIGNSFTARNDLPGLVAELAEARGKSLEHQLISRGGASLRNHLNAGQALAAIKDGHFDSVVLQEQSTLPVKNAKRMHENVGALDEAIQRAGSKTVLYMTWARRSAPESQQAITDAYGSIGRELGATVVPVGAVWQAFLREHDHPVLHDRDGSHPTLAGSYLAACVFLAALLHENPIGIKSALPGLSADDVLLLQTTAWQECRK